MTDETPPDDRAPSPETAIVLDEALKLLFEVVRDARRIPRGMLSDENRAHLNAALALLKKHGFNP